LKSPFGTLNFVIFNMKKTFYATVNKVFLNLKKKIYPNNVHIKLLIIFYIFT